MNFQQNRIKNLFEERLNLLGEKGRVSYWGSRIMEREFMDGFQSAAPWIFEILIVSHDSEDAKKSYKEIQHIKVQCKGGWNMFVCTVVTQYVWGIIKNEPAEQQDATTWHNEMHHCTADKEHVNQASYYNYNQSSH